MLVKLVWLAIITKVHVSWGPESLLKFNENEKTSLVYEFTNQTIEGSTANLTTEQVRD